EQVRRIERDGERLALELAVDLFGRLSEILRSRAELRSVRPEIDPHGRARLREDPDATHSLREALALQPQLIRKLCRNQLVPVRELALDEARRQPPAGNRERRLRLPECDLDLAVAVGREIG